MKIAFVGGHLTPALAVIDSLDNDAEVIFLGRTSSFEGSREKSLEYQEVHKRDIKFYSLVTAKFQRNLSVKTALSFLKMPGGLKQAMEILSLEKPDIVIGFGGYLSLPVGISASILGIPLIIHEQTFSAGLANKILAKFAKKICISWESSKKFFPEKKIVVTGNPLPRTPREPDLILQKSRHPLLLVTGGSSGSHALNLLIENSLAILLQDWRIYHQTGDAKEFGDFDRLLRLKNSLPEDLSHNYEVVKFVSPNNMEYLIGQAKIVIGRSGINTVSQIFKEGKPSIFIPLPIGQKNEQLTNARVAEQKGIAKVILQKDATSEVVIEAIDEICRKYDEYEKCGKLTSRLIDEKASEKIVEVIKYVVKEKSFKKRT